MTCKECIHYEACHDMYYEEHATRHFDPEKHNAEKECGYFKDRARFVEMPCKVGDKVYLDNLHIKYADVIGIYIDAFGGVFDLRIYTNIQLANGFGYEYFISKDYTFEDIGKRIFLTREEAEQALKERENDGK